MFQLSDIVRKWQPTPIFLPGKSHGQRSLVVCSPWGHKESTRLKRLCIAQATSHSKIEWLQLTCLLMSLQSGQFPDSTPWPSVSPLLFMRAMETSQLPLDQVPTGAQKTHGKVSASGIKVITLLTSVCILGAPVVCHIAVLSEAFHRWERSSITF